jgi:two-component system nitrate/nitrite response regulator NarL
MTVLVADQLMVMRSAVRAVLGSKADSDVFEASQLDEVARQVALRAPDLALIDWELPPLGGVAAVAYLSRVSPQTKSIVWAVAPSPAAVADSIRAGACGFLDKQISADGLLRAVSGLARGEAPLSRSIAMRLVEGIHEADERERAVRRAAALSLREREVLSLISEGLPNREIAVRLFISEATVKRHAQNILRKLGEHSRQGAVEVLRAAGEQDLPRPFLRTA